MPTDTFTWEWEEAFCKFGFGDGDNVMHNEDVGEVIARHGWKYKQVLGVHNEFIYQLVKGDKVIDFEGNEDNDEVRRKLPAIVVKALDKQFPAEVTA